MVKRVNNQVQAYSQKKQVLMSKTLMVKRVNNQV